MAKVYHRTTRDGTWTSWPVPILYIRLSANYRISCNSSRLCISHTNLSDLSQSLPEWRNINSIQPERVSACLSRVKTNHSRWHLLFIDHSSNSDHIDNCHHFIYRFLKPSNFYSKQGKRFCQGSGNRSWMWFENRSSTYYLCSYNSLETKTEAKELSIRYPKNSCTVLWTHLTFIGYE